jgi:hypothetical protein
MSDQFAEKKQQFEQNIIDMAIKEYYKYSDVYKRARSEKDAKMFYTAMRLGVIKGINYATYEVAKHNEEIDKVG